MRMEFVRQLNTTPLSELAALGKKWIKVIEDLKAPTERGRELHTCQQQHGGQLPEQYTNVPT